MVKDLLDKVLLEAPQQQVEVLLVEMEIKAPPVDSLVKVLLDHKVDNNQAEETNQEEVLLPQ